MNPGWLIERARPTGIGDLFAGNMSGNGRSCRFKRRWSPPMTGWARRASAGEPTLDEDRDIGDRPGILEVDHAAGE